MLILGTSLSGDNEVFSVDAVVVFAVVFNVYERPAVVSREFIRNSLRFVFMGARARFAVVTKYNDDIKFVA